MHGDILGRKRDRGIHAVAELLKALPRQPRDEVAVDRKPVGPCKPERRDDVRRRVLPADARERRIRKALRVDTDARHAVALADFQLLCGKHVGTPRLHRVFAAVLAQRRDRREHAPELLRLQHEGRSAADIDGAQIPDEGRAGGKLFFQRGEVICKVFARRRNGCGDEGAVLALGRTKGQGDEQIATCVPPLVNALLPIDDTRNERSIFRRDAHPLKERRKGTPRLQLRIGKAGGTDARQRAPRKRDARHRRERIVESKLCIPFYKALVVQFVRPGRFVPRGERPPVHRDGVCKRAALIGDRVQNLHVLGARKQAHDVHELGMQKVKIGRQHRTYPLLRRS